MQVWKPLLVIVPAGLVLGMIGGHYARPVLRQRPGDQDVQRLFAGRSAGTGTTVATELPPQYDIADPNNVPAFTGGDREVTGWQGPDFKDWPSYTPAPMPSIAQLQAENAARNAALGYRAMAGAATGSAEESGPDAAEGAASDTAAGQFGTPAERGQPKTVDFPPRDRSAPPSAEPRTPDGQLPAIW